LDVLCGAGDLPLPQIVRSDLAQIGIAISIVKSDACPVRYTSQTDRADLLLVAMGGPLQRDPEFFLDSFLYGRVFGTVLGPGPWDDAPFRARVARARALSGRARIDAYRRLDDELMQMAPVAVYGSALYTEFVSPKVGCRIFQGYFGFLDLGALCVRR
jgi:hypothetical protein